MSDEVEPAEVRFSAACRDAVLWAKTVTRERRVQLVVNPSDRPLIERWEQRAGVRPGSAPAMWEAEGFVFSIGARQGEPMAFLPDYGAGKYLRQGEQP